MNAAAVKWKFDADFLQACNCDYGCPCEFSAPPTLGYCDGMGAWRITRGHCGEVPLDGLALGFAAHWPKAIHLGGGTGAIFIDTRADARQREALVDIASGKLGGLPFEILATTFSTILEPQFVPIDFHWNGAQSSVRIGDRVHAALEPIRNPVTGDPESVRVEHATGFVFKIAEALSAKEMRVASDSLQFTWPNKAAFIAQVSYAN
jgi:hypothetical protein